jgi:DNA-binding NtrC family response regulator
LHEVGPKRFDDAALRRMERYAWPGNVRELRNAVESLVLTVDGELICAADLPSEMRAADGAGAAAEPGRGALSVLEQSEFEQIYKACQESAGNATLAAKQLGIAKSTLYLKLKKYALDQSMDAWRSSSTH